MNSPYRDDQIGRESYNVPAGSTDYELFGAMPGRSFRVLAVYALATGATALTFRTKPPGEASVAISASFTSADGKPTVDLPFCPHGYFQTAAGEALVVTTGSGQTTALTLTVAILPS